MEWLHGLTTVVLWFCISLNLFGMIRCWQSGQRATRARLECEGAHAEYKKAAAVLSQMIELHERQAHFEKQWLDAVSVGKQEVWEFYNGEILRVNQQLLELAREYAD